MKRKAISIICILSVVSLFTACGVEQIDNVDSLTSTTATEISDTEITSEAEDSSSDDSISAGNANEGSSQLSSQQFQTGLWEMISGEDIEGWYYFSDNMQECSYHDAEGNGGICFDYEIMGTKYDFHMGSYDDNTYATVEFSDSENAVITWESGNTSKIRFVENTTYEDFNVNEGRGDVISDDMAE